MSLSDKARRCLKTGLADRDAAEEVADAIDAAGEIDSSEIADNAVTADAIDASTVVGNGLVGGSGTAISSGMTIYNDTGGSLTAGTLVRVKGYTSTSGITVEKADADAAKPATHVVKTAISNAASGAVYPIARVTGLATNGRTIGDPVYLDSTAGAFTFTAPTGADQLVQQVGAVKVVHASTGEIEFFPGTSQKLAMGTSYLQDGSISVAKQSTAARTRIAIVPFKLPAPTGSNQGPLTRCTWSCSQAITIVGVKIASDTATSGSDGTNNYSFMPKNQTGAANLHSGPTTTQGSELSTTALKTITVSQNLSFTANQVFSIDVNIADDGSAGPTNLSAAQLNAVVEYTV